MTKIAIATGPGLSIGTTVLLGVFTDLDWGPNHAKAACEAHAGAPLHWRGVFGGYECLTGPAGSGYAVRILDADVAYAGQPFPAPHPIPLELAR